MPWAEESHVSSSFTCRESYHAGFRIQSWTNETFKLHMQLNPAPHLQCGHLHGGPSREGGRETLNGSRLLCIRNVNASSLKRGGKKTLVKAMQDSSGGGERGTTYLEMKRREARMRGCERSRFFAKLPGRREGCLRRRSFGGRRWRGWQWKQTRRPSLPSTAAISRLFSHSSTRVHTPHTQARQEMCRLSPSDWLVDKIDEADPPPWHQGVEA